MFSQFQVRYPTGCLISELLSIYNGKYVVRVLVQVDGVTRSTGLAVADTIELAEDQARVRALEVMGIRLSPTADAQIAPEFPKQPTFSPQRLESTTTPSISTDTSWLTETTPPSFPERSSFVPSSGIAPSPVASSAVTGNLDWKRDDYISDAEISSSVNETEPTFSYSKVTPIGSRRQEQEAIALPSHQPSTESSYSTVEQPGLNGPVDHSDLIARIGVEIGRVGWNKRQGSEYLQHKYGKKTRQELTDDELVEFLEYLESLPSPNS